MIHNKTKEIVCLTFILIVFCFSIADSEATDIYKWTNDDGSLGFTDDINKVPEKYRDQIEIKRYEGSGTNTSNNLDKYSDSYNTSISEESDYGYKQEEKQELTEEEIREIDKEIRGTWNNMKDALKKGRIE